MKFFLSENTAHLWRANVPDLLSQVESYTLLLNQEELERAHRYKYEVHRHRYIIARGLLRQILSLYTKILPHQLFFSKGPHGKPFLSSNPYQIQFNVSHSHDVVVYAFNLYNEIGVDTEKVEAHFNENVAKRFFSENENAHLNKLKMNEKIAACYRLWVAKEALIKAFGLGIFTPLNEFSVDVMKEDQLVALNHEQQKIWYRLYYFIPASGYEGALAVPPEVEMIKFGEWTPHGPAVWRD